MIQQWLGLPVAASAHAGEIDRLLALVHLLMFVLFAGWSAFFVWVLVRFRRSRSPRADYDGLRRHTPTWLEAGVACAELLLLGVIALPLWSQRVGAVPADSSVVRVRVVAEQFAWNVHYPGPDGVFGRTDPALVSPTNPLGLDPNDPAGRDDVTTVNELDVPLGRTVLVQLSSKDVIHSFGIPAMRVKQDAVPGLVVPVWFVPTRVGEFDIACSQLCGLAHYRMRGILRVR
jgi:cytochrome c oxidase subunit II